MSAGMAEVIAAHSIAGMSAGTHLACRCNKTWVPFPGYHAHLAEELAKAGYGNVREAKERAWVEGRESLARDFHKPMNDAGIRESTPNPCRAAKASHGVD